MTNVQNLCQIEIKVTDIDRSLSFYEKVFGWVRVPADIHEYHVLKVPEEWPFGVSLVPTKVLNPSNSVVNYFHTNSVQTVLDDARKNGGDVVFGPKILPGYGSLFHIKDPDGNTIGVFSEEKIKS